MHLPFIAELLLLFQAPSIQPWNLEFFSYPPLVTYQPPPTTFDWKTHCVSDTSHYRPSPWGLTLSILYTRGFKFLKTKFLNRQNGHFEISFFVNILISDHIFRVIFYIRYIKLNNEILYVAYTLSVAFQIMHDRKMGK